MKVVWRLGTATVRDVYEALLETRRIAYTTVMTMMNILEAKGYLKKEKHDRAFRYRPARPERAVVGSMVREFVNRVFDGASRPLLLHLVKDSRLNEQERMELLRLIKDAQEAG
jgi:predicted transcriptional regulator